MKVFRFRLSALIITANVLIAALIFSLMGAQPTTAQEAPTCDDPTFGLAQQAYLNSLSPSSGITTAAAETLRVDFARTIANCYAQVDVNQLTIDEEPVVQGSPSRDGSANYLLAGLKWGGGTEFATNTNPQIPGGTVYWSYLPNGLTSDSGTTVAITSLPTYQACFLTEIENAFAAWEAVANIQFVQVTDSGANFDTVEGNKGHIRVGGHAMDGAFGVLAHAFYPPPNGITSAGDLHFDVAENWQCTAGGGQIDIGIVAVHEIGHSIGLDHEPTLLAVMNAFYNASLTTLQTDDINGARAIYGNSGTPGINIVDSLTGPYPASKVVSGLDISISDVNVTLTGVYHTWPDDMDVLLVSPAGQGVLLMSDTCLDVDLVNVNLTFDDSAATAIPGNTGCTSGSYRPADYQAGEVFVAPAPASGYTTTLSSFNGSNPNGTWNLYIIDDASGDTGGIVTWDLQITAGAALPSLSINNVTLTEGNSGTKAFNFTASLSAASAQTVTVNYATGDGSAVAPGDYTAGNGTVTFNPGETSKQITVLVNGETTHEPHENFTVNLSNATNATIADSQGVGQINNDDGRPTIRVNDLARTEGGIGVQTNLPFTVSLSNPSYQTITVQFVTGDGTATTADSDYTPQALTTLTFNPGQTSRNVTVILIGDAKHEPHETLNLTLSNATNATIADSVGVGTIANDDSRPTISVNDVSRAEGNSGTTNFPFVVTLSHPSYQTITVNFATSDVTANAGTDYTARSGSLSFAPGVTSRNITVVGNGDTVFEPNETFNFNLSTAANATIADGQGAGTITNDDAAGLSEEGVQIVPVAPELPQFLPVAPVMPDAPVQPAQPTEAVPLMPAGAATTNPVMFMWRGATGASSYSLQITTEAGELVYEGVFSASVDCAGEICQALPDVALTAGTNYLWSIQADAQARSFAMLFTYTPSTFSPIVNP